MLLFLTMLSYPDRKNEVTFAGVISYLCPKRELFSLVDCFGIREPILLCQPSSKATVQQQYYGISEAYATVGASIALFVSEAPILRQQFCKVNLTPRNDLECHSALDRMNDPRA